MMRTEKDLGEMTAQLCGQHGFGDGKKLSCSRTVKCSVKDVLQSADKRLYVYQYGGDR